MLQLYAWISNEGDFLKFLSQYSYILLCSSTYTVLKKTKVNKILVTNVKNIYLSFYIKKYPVCHVQRIEYINTPW